MIRKLIPELLDKIILELKKKNNFNKIKLSIIDPLVYYLLNRIYPYFLIIFIIFVLTFILVLVILLFLIKHNLNIN